MELDTFSNVIMKKIEIHGMYDAFPRSGVADSRSTHYCAGCGHGIVHKLMAEAMAELQIQDRTIIFNPVGCSVFGYLAWDVFGL